MYTAPNGHAYALFHFFISHEVNECITEHSRQEEEHQRNGERGAKNDIEFFVTEDGLDSMSSAFNGASSVIVPRFGVQVAVLEHTPASLPEQKKNKPQRHPVRSHGMEDDVVAMRASVLEGIPDELPPHPGYDESVDHAPNRRQILSAKDKGLALENALRYIPPAHHAEMADEFMEELETYGRILMRRYRPTSHPIKAYPLDAYPAKSRQAAAIMLMIHNNLDPAVAQFPHELITYGGNGSVFQNWAQYRLAMKYLCEMTDSQTLVMYSGHPLGLFPSHEEAPRRGHQRHGHSESL